MLRRKLAESLTVRIFLLTFLLLLGAGGLTFALIAWATPITYTAVISDRLQAQVADLTQQLAQTNLADAGPILDAFVRESGAEVALTAPGGAEADTGSLLVLPEEDWQVAVTMSGADNSVQTYEADTYQVQIDRADGVVTATQTGILTTQITFADQEGTYQLLVSPQLRLANQAVEALGRVAPWLALALLAFSLLCAFGYSRYITRPIVRLNGIAGRMAELDLQWVCGERRRDEIGQLGRSLDKMARRLSAALTDLETANQALRGEVARERELDRQRMAFFSAASHELKTPVTILKGQLAGMLEGVGVYQDRDKYLLRSLQTTGRMERLIGEMLSISRMESGSAAVRQEPVDLSARMAQQLALDRELLEQRGQQLVSALTPGITVPADASLLGKAVGNLLSNASRYSPEGAEIRVWCGRLEGRPALSVENTGARVSGDALPHLFEAFYREEGSRNRSTGGSGLGLYLVKMILDRHGAALTGTALLALACISEAACFYGIYFGWYGWSGLVFPTLVTLVPPLVFALGSGWLLGMLRPWLLYVWMLVSPVCLALPLPESLGLWNGRLFAQYPLTLGTLDPAFTLPAAVLFVQFVLLASGVVLLAVRPEGQRQH